eukprot:1948533-Rhodomonas_salina.1
MELLGMRFDPRTHLLSIPDRKCQEIIVLLEDMLNRVDKEQSVSWHELESMTGKLMWGIHGGGVRQSLPAADEEAGDRRVGNAEDTERQAAVLHTTLPIPPS